MRVTVGTLILCLQLGAATAGAQDNTAASKSPRTAATVGAFIPGGGHMYAGEFWRGAALFGVSAGSIITAVAVLNNDHCGPSEGFFTCDPGEVRRDSQAVAALNFALGGVAWVISALDAPRAVRRQQEKERLRVGDADVRPREWKAIVAPAQRTGNRVLLGVHTNW
jgi:hypothetical protein